MVASLFPSLVLLRRLQRLGLGPVVLCPGSRSAPLAAAAALLEPLGLELYSAIDERSAAFFALGLARALGRPAAVITTSGSAVANLLPAVVEADYGAIPLLLLSADRPARLKGCGANQSVNQEQFLVASCRWRGQGDPAGLAAMAPEAIEALADRAMAAALPGWGWPAGPVHLNLPLEEPLHARASDLLPWQGPHGQRALAALASSALPPSPAPHPAPTGPWLDPDQPGVVVAGPWRGLASRWPGHQQALRAWCRRSGWPLLADPLSGLRGDPQLPLIPSYDLLLEQPEVLGAAAQPPQVLRLGPLPASRRLQQWLERHQGVQLLITEGEPRPLDPLGTSSAQLACGLEAWVEVHPQLSSDPVHQPVPAAAPWRQTDTALQALLSEELPLDPAPAAFSEPWLARALGQLLPAGVPLMLANSSPVRDWETFAAASTPERPVYGFRGASGIDGTLSIACGLAQALGQLVLVSGDLALLHDSNGWLWRQQLRGQLTVLLVDNGGGGIFEQLPIRTDPQECLDFERLFAMPQAVDPLALAAAHGVPARRLEQPRALAQELAWALEQPLALLQVPTQRQADAALRRRLRTMAARLRHA